MKNILYIDTGYEFGGGTKSFLYLLKYLNKEIYKPYVFFKHNYKVGDVNISETIFNYEGQFIKNNFKQGKLSKIKKELIRVFSKKLLQKIEFKYRLDFARDVLNSIEKIDLIHLNNHFGTNLEYIIVANELNIPIIQHLRKNSSLSKWEIEILKQQKFHSISVSKSTYNFYSKFLKINNLVIYNPFMINEKNYEIQNQKIKILFPANYLKNKGHKLVFEAIKNIKSIEIILAGNGIFDKETETLKNNLENITELGFVEDISKLYKQVDYVISFSENEGLPRVIIEGLLYGCGIISSNFKAAEEIYELSEKRNFYIIQRKSKELNDLLKNIKPIENKIPDQKIKTIFSLNNYISQIENLYKSLL